MVPEDADAATTVEDQDMDLSLSLSLSMAGMVPEDVDADVATTVEVMNTNKVIASLKILFAGIPVRIWKLIVGT